MAVFFPALCKFLGEPNNAGKDYTLKDIFWQVPFVHRAFCLTYKQTTELFIPLLDTCFMRKDGSKEAWFQAAIKKRYISAHIQKNIQPGFELLNPTVVIGLEESEDSSGRAGT